MSDVLLDSKQNLFIDYVNNSSKNEIEFYVEGLGWLIVLKENIEIVTDNWFASTKYLASTIEVVDENSKLILFSNIYKHNSSFIENVNNTQYSLWFDEINIFANKIVAFF